MEKHLLTWYFPKYISHQPNNTAFQGWSCSCSHWNEMPELCSSTTSVVCGRFQWTNSRCVLPWWHPVSHYLCLFRTSLERLPHTGISSSSMCRLHKIQLIWLPGVPVDKRIHNNLQWHGPSWLTDHPSQWPSWRSTQFYSKMSEQNTKQSPGPDVMYETTALAGIPRENSRISLDKPVASFDIIKWNYSC